MDAISPVKSEEVPPRRHPEDEAATSSDLSDTESTSTPNNNEDNFDDDDDFVIPGTGPKDMPLLKSSSHLTGSYQTGVKGVIADATSFESARRRKKKARVTSPYGGYKGPEADVRAPLQQQHNSGGDSDLSGDDDEDFVRTWRKKRMDELRTASSQTRRKSPSKRKYGRMEEVDAVGYLDAVEKVSSDTIVVVMIFNEESDESQFVSDCLATLARRYQTTRFVKLHHVEAEMEVQVVPAILAYKAGDLFANLIRVVDEIPPGRNLSAESLDLVLRRANVLIKE